MTLQRMSIIFEFGVKTNYVTRSMQCIDVDNLNTLNINFWLISYIARTVHHTVDENEIYRIRDEKHTHSVYRNYYAHKTWITYLWAFFHSAFIFFPFIFHPRYSDDDFFFRWRWCVRICISYFIRNISDIALHFAASFVYNVLLAA